MGNSSLSCMRMVSPFRSSPRNHKIDTITIHCTAGQGSVETLCNLFQINGASCNYAIGSDGRICTIVDEADRSWCSSSPANDNRGRGAQLLAQGHPGADGEGRYQWHRRRQAGHDPQRLQGRCDRQEDPRKAVKAYESPGSPFWWPGLFCFPRYASIASFTWSWAAFRVSNQSR